MLAYQSGIAKFDGSDTQVFGISEDFTLSQKEFAEKNKLTFPLLSDFSKRKVATDYGVLIQDLGIANRSTFVIDKEGKVKHIHFLSAFPDQAKAITDAMGQWKFKRHLRDGQPVEVETGIMFGRASYPTAHRSGESATE